MSVEQVIAALRKGRMAIIRRVQGDHPTAACVVVASRCTPRHVSFMATNARGLICVALSQLRAERLNLTPQAPNSRHGRAGDVLLSIEAREGVSTGISASDRSHTIRVLASETSEPNDLLAPGHVFPVTVHKHGVLSRPEISDAAADLARLSGFPPVATYCKILDDDGAIMSPQAVPEFAKKHKIPWIDVDDIVAFRNRHEVLVTCEVLNHHDTPFGPCTFRVYRSDVDNLRHIVITMGDINDALPLVRVHSQCLTGDAFGSLRCDCGAQLDSAMSKIAEEGRGVMIYLLQEGRGIGFLNKVRAYALQDEGQDTVEANLSLGLGVDLRNYGVAAHILNDLGVTNCRLLTNNPKKLEALTAAGIDIAERLPLEIDPDPHTRPYLTTKKYKLGHILEKV